MIEFDIFFGRHSSLEDGELKRGQKGKKLQDQVITGKKKHGAM